jgi:hypothetical protein
MGELPFVVIHGAWLWAIGVAAGVLLGFAVARWARGRGEHARAEAEVEKWTARVTVPILSRAEGEIVSPLLGGFAGNPPPRTRDAVQVRRPDFTWIGGDQFLPYPGWCS